VWKAQPYQFIILSIQAARKADFLNFARRRNQGVFLNSLKCIFGVFSAISAFQILDLALLSLRIFHLI